MPIKVPQELYVGSKADAGIFVYNSAVVQRQPLGIFLCSVSISKSVLYC